MTFMMTRSHTAATLPTAALSRAVTTRGACLDSSNPDAWFPPEPNPSGGESPEALAIRRADYEHTARQLCGPCPVRAQCLELALREEHDLPQTWFHGIRGGKAPWQRRSMVRRRRQAAARQIAETSEAVA
ncbi:WhiB family transcriptional regulator [Planobispora rosea]|uniref:WhiB family transcriptional regulator n=1 Tax=Planobispora rosea TaxID=35762 RepID=UPI00083A16C5|nr:WhiB family transcriptional regulator [Planobispora rosea]